MILPDRGALARPPRGSIDRGRQASQPGISRPPDGARITCRGAILKQIRRPPLADNRAPGPIHARQGGLCGAPRAGATFWHVRLTCGPRPPVPARPPGRPRATGRPASPAVAAICRGAFSHHWPGRRPICGVGLRCQDALANAPGRGEPGGVCVSLKAKPAAGR
jgi:hypothetical protein